LKELEGKVAFVTGGASGIGLGMVRAMLSRGMKVVAADIRQDHLDHATNEIGQNARSHFLLLDVTDRKAMADAAAETERVFGKIHIVCNNAGAGIIGGAREASYDDWDWSIAVNLTSVFNGVHTFLPYMRKHGEGGHFVNTASIGALLPSNILYGAAKGGVMTLSEALCGELAAKSVGVTCLLPGPTATNINQVAALRPDKYQNTRLGTFEGQLRQRKNSPYWMDPLEVGQMVVDAIERNLLFVFTHNEHREGVAKRFEAIMAAFPIGDVDPQRAGDLGFRVSNPMYAEILAAKQAPARSLRTEKRETQSREPDQ
jgi:NAD(P)-dependent dehydrogenase (short-subunit alcohol dehydrogenase family)